MKHFVQKLLIVMFMYVTNMYAGAGAITHPVIPQEVEKLCIDMIMPSVKSLEGETCKRAIFVGWTMMPGIAEISQPYLETPMGKFFKKITIKGFSATLAHKPADITAGEQAFNSALQNEQVKASLFHAKKTKTLDDWKSFNNSLRSFLAEEVAAFDANLKLDDPLETIKLKASTPLASYDINRVAEEQPITVDAESAFKAALVAVAFGHKLHFMEHPESFKQFAQHVSEASTVYMIESHINQ